MNMLKLIFPFGQYSRNYICLKKQKQKTIECIEKVVQQVVVVCSMWTIKVFFFILQQPKKCGKDLEADKNPDAN